MIPAKVRGSGTAMQGMEEGVQSFPHLEAQHGAITLASYKYLLRYHFSKEIGVSMRV